jgi:hypothetical protein
MTDTAAILSDQIVDRVHAHVRKHLSECRGRSREELELMFADLRGEIAQILDANIEEVDQVNAFLELAERQISAPVKTRQRAAEKRAVRKAEQKALAERDCMFAAWKRWRRERLDAALGGPHGEMLQALITFLKTMKSADALVDHVRTGNWKATDTDTRFLALHLVNSTIVRLHEERGLPPFDDALPGEPPTAFQIIREMLR